MPTDPSGRLRQAAVPAALAAAIALAYAPAALFPLRLWDHHALLLLAKCPQVREGLARHLLHYHLHAASDPYVYFRVLAMPLVYAIALLGGDCSAVYFGIHFAAHLGACLACFALARALGAARVPALLGALIFALYAGHADTVAIPLFTFMAVGMSLAGCGIARLLRHLREGDARSLSLAMGLLCLATLFYDAFLLATLSAPLLALSADRDRRLPGVRRAAFLLGVGALLLFLGVAATAGLGLDPALGGPRSLAVAVGHSLSGLTHGLGLAWKALEALVADVLVFLPGGRPKLFHPGNMLYWDRADLEKLLVRADLRILPLAALAAAPLLPGSVRGSRRPLVLLMGLALLCSFNIALGRAGTNVFILRHHYVTGFFVAALAAGWASRAAGWARGMALLALLACLGANARNVSGMLQEVAEGNRAVLAFDALLGRAVREGRVGDLFVPFPTSAIQGRDWRASPAQDIVFDLLHAAADPLTRHVRRARRRLTPEGEVVDNPLFGTPDPGDFLFAFDLAAPLPEGEPFEAFGSAPGEPRILLGAGALLFQGRGDRLRFAFPAGLRYPARIEFRRSGGAFHLAVNGAAAGSQRVPEGEGPEPWRSDNLGLLGKDFERLLISRNLSRSLMVIGLGEPETAVAPAGGFSHDSPPS